MIYGLSTSPPFGRKFDFIASGFTGTLDTNIGVNPQPVFAEPLRAVYHSRTMVRNNKQFIRLFFVLVICAGLYGYAYALINWQFSAESLTSFSFDEESDWIDVIAALGEEVLQLFLGLTSPAE